MAPMTDRRTFVKSLVIGATLVPLAARRGRAQPADPFSEIHRAADPAHLTPEERMHAPILTLPARVRRGRAFELGVAIGAPLHESTADHHIEAIEVRAGGRPVARVELVPGMTGPSIRLLVVLQENESLGVLAMCSRHGLWETVREVTVG
jgi:superoxide reductase